MKKCTLFFKRLGLIVALLFINLSFSQNATLSGIISDASGAPIPGVNIIIKNTTASTSTDIDGKYFFPNLKNEEATLIVSYIGYKTTEIKITVNGNTSKNITLTGNSNV